MPQIFISYAHKNQAKAKLLEELLTQSLYDVTAWYDSGLSAGQEWWDQILDQIEFCDVFFFVLSAQSAASRACLAEFQYAQALNKPVLVVALDKTKQIPGTESGEFLVDGRKLDSQQLVIELSKTYFLILDRLQAGGYPAPAVLPPRPAMPGVELPHPTGQEEETLTPEDVDEKTRLFTYFHELKKHAQSEDRALAVQARISLGRMLNNPDLTPGLQEEIERILTPAEVQRIKSKKLSKQGLAVVALVILVLGIAVLWGHRDDQYSISDDLIRTLNAIQVDFTFFPAQTTGPISIPLEIVNPAGTPIYEDVFPCRPRPGTAIGPYFYRLDGSCVTLGAGGPSATPTPTPTLTPTPTPDL